MIAEMQEQKLEGSFSSFHFISSSRFNRDLYICLFLFLQLTSDLHILFLLWCLFELSTVAFCGIICYETVQYHKILCDWNWIIFQGSSVVNMTKSNYYLLLFTKQSWLFLLIFFFQHNSFNWMANNFRFHSVIKTPIVWLYHVFLLLHKLLVTIIKKWQTFSELVWLCYNECWTCFMTNIMKIFTHVSLHICMCNKKYIFVLIELWFKLDNNSRLACFDLEGLTMSVAEEIWN